MATLFEQCSKSSTNAQPGHAPVDAIIFVRLPVKLPYADDPGLVGRLDHEALAPRSHPDATPALAALLRLRLDPVGKSDSSVQVTDGVGVSQDRIVVQRPRSLFWRSEMGLGAKACGG